jgi:hypothetical protein
MIRSSSNNVLVPMLSAILISATAPAFAASSQCAVGFNHPACRTKAIQANAANHFIHISVSPYMSYQVVDTANGVVVASGKAGFLGVRKTITGLYSRYHAAIRDNSRAAVAGWIDVRND